MPSLNIVFAGTPEFAALHLKALLAGPHRVLAVYTQPDRRTGRGKKLSPSPVKLVAEQHQIPVIQHASLKDPATHEELRALQPDLLVVVAYGLILPAGILQAPRLGCINVHASLLPRWRGAAPIERALLAGDKKTGVTIMQMDEGLDTGDMLLHREVTIDNDDTRETLMQKVADAGAQGLSYALDNIATLQKNAEPQNDTLSTYAGKLEKSEALIHWQSDAVQIDRQVRAGIGRHPAYCFFNNERLRILAAIPRESNHGAPAGNIIEVSRNGLLVDCGTGSLQITHVQLPGKNPVSISDLLNSQPQLFMPGASLSNQEPEH